MDIHQMQLRYDATADRILWQVRTRGGELLAAWLTRRMLGMMWPPFRHLVAEAGLPVATRPGALVMPEARDMLVQSARERPLPGADFGTPFNPEAAAQPLGAEPLLPNAVDLGPRPQGHGLAIRLRENGGRSMALQMDADLASALLRLLEKALSEADWGLQTVADPAAAPATTPAPRVLN